MKRIVVAITGATGAVYGIRLLKALRDSVGVETHLIVSDYAARIIAIETNYTVAEVTDLAHHGHAPEDMTASLASGSFPVAGMAIVPCSMRTLAAVAHGLADNLITRAADVALKEKRTLVLAPRETPLNLVHLENMASLARAGACLMPPMPAFYNRPAAIDDLIEHFVGRVMDQLSLPHNLSKPWGGVGGAG